MTVAWGAAVVAEQGDFGWDVAWIERGSGLDLVSSDACQPWPCRPVVLADVLCDRPTRECFTSA